MAKRRIYKRRKPYKKKSTCMSSGGRWVKQHKSKATRYKKFVRGYCRTRKNRKSWRN